MAKATMNSAPRRVRDHLGDEAEELLKHRFGIVNVWRLDGIASLGRPVATRAGASLAQLYNR